MDGDRQWMLQANSIAPTILVAELEQVAARERGDGVIRRQGDRSNGV